MSWAENKGLTQLEVDESDLEKYETIKCDNNVGDLVIFDHNIVIALNLFLIVLCLELLVSVGLSVIGKGFQLHVQKRKQLIKVIQWLKRI